MKKMQIPTSLILAGQLVKVVKNPKLIHDNEWYGAAVYRESKIELQTSTKSRPLTRNCLEVSFCHELVHWILHSMGESEKNKDEKFVELFGVFLHQALTTKRGNLQ